jgi:Nucleotidyl transferase AbiEii toxin, Type IV TA system
VREMHQRLAAIGLGAAEQYGFVLAGGYAISAHGMGDRPSMDVDLFTNQAGPERFDEAVDRVQAAFRAAGLQVEDKNRAPLFADMCVSDPVTGEASDIQLGMNYREFPPATIELGPVLDPRDAVAGKMSALWSRGEARDYIDIDIVLGSGRFTREDVLALADEQEATPMDRPVLAGQFRGAGRWPAGEYARYEVDAGRRSVIIERFAAWAEEIDPAAGDERDRQV